MHDNNYTSMNVSKARDLIRIVVSLVLGMSILCSGAAEPSRSNLTSVQAGEAFVSAWYLLNVRGLPNSAEIEGLKKYLSPQLYESFLSASKLQQRIAKKLGIEEKRPYSEGDLLSGGYEAPIAFYSLAEAANAQVEVKFMLDFMVDVQAHEKSSIVLHISKLKVLGEEQRITDAVGLDGGRLTDRLKAIIAELTTIEAVPSE